MALMIEIKSEKYLRVKLRQKNSVANCAYKHLQMESEIPEYKKTRSAPYKMATGVLARVLEYEAPKRHLHIR